jgi:hypothetical protein
MQGLFLPEWSPSPFRGVFHVERAVYVVVRAKAIRQVTEREYPVREVAQRLGVSTYDLSSRLYTDRRRGFSWKLDAVNRKPHANKGRFRGEMRVLRIPC